MFWMTAVCLLLYCFVFVAACFLWLVLLCYFMLVGLFVSVVVDCFLDVLF